MFEMVCASVKIIMLVNLFYLTHAGEYGRIDLFGSCGTKRFRIFLSIFYLVGAHRIAICWLVAWLARFAIDERIK